jgi:outer membrane protein assembly factor BamA
MDQFKTFPIDFYLKLFADFGYVDDRNTRTLNNRFTNKYLASYGAGLDIATFYDLVFRIEYALNQDLDDSFFLNLKAAF